MALASAVLLGGGDEKLGLLSRGGMEAVRPCQTARFLMAMKMIEK